MNRRLFTTQNLIRANTINEKVKASAQDDDVQMWLRSFFNLKNMRLITYFAANLALTQSLSNNKLADSKPVDFSDYLTEAYKSRSLMDPKEMKQYKDNIIYSKLTSDKDFVGYDMWLPVLSRNDFHFYSVNSSYFGGANTSLVMLTSNNPARFAPPNIQNILKWFEAVFSPAIWDLDQCPTVEQNMDIGTLFKNSVVQPEHINIKLGKKNVMETKHDQGFTGYMMDNFTTKFKIISETVGQGNRGFTSYKIRSLDEWKKLDEKTRRDKQLITEDEAKLHLLKARQQLWYVMVKIHADQKVCQAITSQKKPSFLDMHNYMSEAVTAISSSKMPPENYTPMSRIRDSIKGKTIPWTRTNKYDLSINEKGELWYFPDLDNVDELERKVIESGTNIGTAEKVLDGVKYKQDVWSFDSLVTRKPERKQNDDNAVIEERDSVAHRIILCDKFNDVISYYNGNNTLDLIDTRKYRKADPLQLYNMADTPIMETTRYNPTGNMAKILAEFQTYLRGSALANKHKRKVKVDIEDFLCLNHPQDKARSLALIFDTAVHYRDNSITSQILAQTGMDESSSDELSRIIKDYGCPNILEYIRNVGQAMANVQSKADKMEGNPWKDSPYKWIADTAVDSITLRDIHPESNITLLRPLGHYLQMVTEDIASDPIKYVNESTNAVDITLKSVAFAIFWNKCITNKEFEKRALAMKDSIRDEKTDDNWQPYPLPGIEDDFELFPQQGYMLQKMLPNIKTGDKPIEIANKIPTKIFMNSEPGAGKTLTALYHHAYLKKLGIVNKTLIICPKYLMANYVEDGKKMFGGSLNIVPITNQLVDMYGYDGTIKLINQLAKQPNTIFITDDEFVKGKDRQAFSYGTKSLRRSLNNDMILHAKFDAVTMDECHRAKNDNIRSNNIQNITSLADINCAMSGTTIHNDISDLVGQMALLDPSALESKDNFEKLVDTFLTDFTNLTADTPDAQGLDVPRPNANQVIFNKITASAKAIDCGKEKWEHTIPARKLSIYLCKLSSAQEAVNEILMELLDTAIDRLKRDPKFKKVLADIDTEDENKNEEEGAEKKLIEVHLRPFIQRLEKFASNPDPEAITKVEGEGEDFDKNIAKIKKLMKNDSKISPKSKVFNDLVMEHINANPVGKNALAKPPNFGDADDIKSCKNGKILAVCNYKSSRDHLYENLPPELKSKFILYEAETKQVHIDKFRNDPNIIGMIAIGESLTVGWNFQFVSRLIRMESIWQPGAFEQSEYRIRRPGGNLNKIPVSFVDILAVDNTVDIPKLARLFAKITQKTVVQDRTGQYASVKPMPKIVMNVKTIIEHRNVEMLKPYLVEFQKIEDIDNKRAAKAKKSKKTPKNIKIPKEAMKPGSVYLTGVPYLDSAGIPVDTDKYPILGDPVSTSAYATSKGVPMDEIDLTGLHVHTEYGDGVVISSLKQRNRTDDDEQGANVRVRIDNFMGKKGNSITKSVPRTKLYVFMDQETAKVRTQSVSQEIAQKYITLPTVSIANAKAIQDMAENEGPVEEAPEVEGSGTFALKPVAWNNFIGTVIKPTEAYSDPVLLKKMGFKETGDFAFATLTKPILKKLHKEVTKYLAKDKVEYPEMLRTNFDAFYNAWMKSPAEAQKVRQITNTEALKLARSRRKVFVGKKGLYMIFTGEIEPSGQMQLHLMLSTETRDGKQMLKHLRKKVPQLRLRMHDSIWINYSSKVSEARKFATDLHRQYGVSNFNSHIENLEKIKVVRKTIK